VLIFVNVLKEVYDRIINTF